MIDNQSADLNDRLARVAVGNVQGYRAATRVGWIGDPQRTVLGKRQIVHCKSPRQQQVARARYTAAKGRATDFKGCAAKQWATSIVGQHDRSVEWRAAQYQLATMQRQGPRCGRVALKDDLAADELQRFGDRHEEVGTTAVDGRIVIGDADSEPTSHATMRAELSRTAVRNRLAVPAYTTRLCQTEAAS